MNDFEKEMLERIRTKVCESAAAIDFLHSNNVFEGGDKPRRSHQ